MLSRADIGNAKAYRKKALPLADCLPRQSEITRESP